LNLKSKKKKGKGEEAQNSEQENSDGSYGREGASPGKKKKFKLRT
jgi:hypothetical protein